MTNGPWYLQIVAHMNDLETLQFGTLTLDDMAAVLALSEEAGWTQVSDDWALMMTTGSCVGFRDKTGVPIASGVALPMDDKIGWVSMILVTKDWQRKGLATKLVENCCNWLEEQGITPLLDATPDGRAVYSKMGFSDQLGITRWRCEAITAVKEEEDCQARADDLIWISDYDAEVFGACRPSIVGNLMMRGPAFVDKNQNGILLGREGRGVTQIGPISAENGTIAANLLDAALSSLSGTVTIDAFDAQLEFASHLAARGFKAQRGFTRMTRGPVTPLGKASHAFAAAGPELG
ncbi:GNAT family N-acetyltransferase [Sneathiella sp. HT1-7]|uniref:GNAT family N-acetyltransferase n=1 Tax=Sneathiella sp. HT1-7 TaxID=2887192 RepID=UPI001D133ED3|nr:GNAT family N-acetyltransferase [Sneathiella sp. HT1-7]MCC3305228.1 GNAT family N-acetyltransferase [Sneathiella sp. HT1-7]